MAAAVTLIISIIVTISCDRIQETTRIWYGGRLRWITPIKLKRRLIKPPFTFTLIGLSIVIIYPLWLLSCQFKAGNVAAFKLDTNTILLW